ncbi:MAG: 16S rRNA (guanine(966)-N(2))-methyltransferase RsmD [Bdellovibrionia bacterium]
MLRITGGQFRGRMIQTPAQDHTRPTQARLREAWFNSLGPYLQGARVLDLFAGSGALGFEALSRGASHVVCVENSKPALRVIHQNIQALALGSQIEVFGLSVTLALSHLKKKGPFDLIFADPPYAEGWEMKMLEQWPWGELLASDGRFCLEWGVQKSQVSQLPDCVSGLKKVREKHYGDTMLSTYSWATPEDSSQAPSEA